MLKVNENKLKPPEIQIFERVSKQEISDNTTILDRIEEDIRIIILKSIKRTNDDAVIRNPFEMVETALNIQEEILYEMNPVLDKDDKTILKNDCTL